MQMKKRIACLLFLCLYAFSSSVFAANWIFVTRGGPGAVIPDSQGFIDADSVAKNDDLLIFWDKFSYKNVSNEQKIRITKHEVNLSNGSGRVLEYYVYDAGGKEIDSKTTSGSWDKYDPGSYMGLVVNAALPYAQKTPISGSKPGP